jgi:hypothetical protein
VAVDRGTIGHDLFPKRSDYCEGPDQRCYRLGVLTIGSKDIVLEYIVPKAPVTVRAIYANPADAFWSGSISDCTENGFSR